MLTLEDEERKYKISVKTELVLSFPLALSIHALFAATINWKWSQIGLGLMRAHFHVFDLI